MSEKRFVYIEHKGTDYILDSPNWNLDFIEMLGDSLEPKEVVGLLNTLHKENEQLRQTTKTQQIRIYCQDKEIQKLNEQLNKIPNTIKEVWIE